jgi:anti-sigma B factor antagonist
MAFQVNERAREGVAILDLSGRLTLGDAVSELRNRLQELIAAGKTRVVLNLAEVGYIDSSGLGTLVMMHASVQKAGGSMKLLNLNRKTIEMLVMTKLTMVFEVFDDEMSAVNSYFPDREIRKFDILDFLNQQKK